MNEVSQIQQQAAEVKAPNLQKVSLYMRQLRQIESYLKQERALQQPSMFDIQNLKVHTYWE